MLQGQNGNKILFIYPALFRITGLPIGIASLSAVLKENGYQTKVFDTAFYDLSGKQDWDKLRADRLMSKRIVNEEQHGRVKTTDAKKDLIKLIDEFKPKIIGLSVSEPNCELGLMLARLVKEKYQDIIIVAGGVYPTLSPDIIIEEKCIDVICLGEGETAFLELCDKVSSNQEYHDIEGLWVKHDGKVYKNRPGKLHDINKLPHPDFSVFDEELFYKPMQGRLYKMVNIETSRGCPYNCTYCAAPRLKEFFLSKSGSSYYRSMNMERIIEQMHYQIKKHSPEFIYFSSETFLAMDEKEFNMFIEAYRKIKIPFWFQTRFETITEDRIRALKEVGMFWLTLGVEHGNEQFRRNILKRIYSNDSIIRGISALNQCQVGASLNNMMGFPMENRELIFETIKLNKQLFEINKRLEFNIFMFVPFRGCELYDLCRQKGLLPDQVYSTGNDLSDESVLNFSKEYKEELRGLMRTFNLYVELPEEYYPQIRIAERFDKEGDEIFNSLSQLLGERRRGLTK